MASGRGEAIQNGVAASNPLPLSSKALEAAQRLFEEHLPQWRASDAALLMLKEALPGFCIEVNLTKIASVNTLYGTNLRATHRMAVHIADVIRRLGTETEPVMLVNSIASMRPLPGEAIRTHRSFASKFCSFFIDDERFPILDGAACDAIKLHLGAARCKGIQTSYEAFLSALTELRAQHRLETNNRGLDRYLWIAGMYLRFERGDREINRDLLALFHREAAVQDLQFIAESIRNRASGK